MRMFRQKAFQLALNLSLTFLVDWRDVWSLTHRVEPIWLATADLFARLRYSGFCQARPARRLFLRRRKIRNTQWFPNSHEMPLNPHDRYGR